MTSVTSACCLAAAGRMAQARDFKTLSGLEVAGHAVDFLRLKNQTFVLSLLSTCTFWSTCTLCSWSSSWHEWQLYSRTRLLSLLSDYTQVTSAWLVCTELSGRSDLRASNQNFPKLTKWYLYNEILFKLSNTLKFPEYSLMFWYGWQHGQVNSIRFTCLYSYHWQKWFFLLCAPHLSANLSWGLRF